MKKILTGLFSIWVINCCFPQAVVKSIKKLPDTGQIKDFTSTFGEDSDYLILMPSYTNNNDGTITDNVTGLMWQRVDGGEMTLENAKKYADTLSLGLYTDWRLPTPLEAYTLMNHNNNNPALDRDFFPNSGAQYWWTSATQFNDPGKCWVTNAGGGIGNHSISETISAGGSKFFHIRAVRDINAPQSISEQYGINGEVVTDQITSLMWVTVPATILKSWDEALRFAESFEAEGFSDWRLPNIKELHSLTDVTRGNPSVNFDYFPEIITAKYWSSTSLSNQAGLAWHLDTRFGITTYTDKNQKLNIVLVRNVETTGTSDLESSKSYHFQNPIERKIPIQNEGNNLEFMLFDLNGKIIYMGKNIADQDLSNLNPGQYFLKIKDGEKIEIVKILKF